MMHYRVAAAVLGVASLLAGAPVAAQGMSWRIDPLHSAAHFTVRHMMISTVRGQFGGVKGAVQYDPNNPGAAKVEATIDASTVNTADPKRDADLKGKEFFDISRFPVMKFKSSRIDVASPGKLKVTGDLTINDITREVVLNVEGPTPPIRDTQGREKVGVNATTTISRKEFGITYNPVLETGGVVVSDEVSIILDLELIRNQS